MTIGIIYNESSMLSIPASMSVTKNLFRLPSYTLNHYLHQVLETIFLSPHACIIPLKLPRKPNAE